MACTLAGAGVEPGPAYWAKEAAAAAIRAKARAVFFMASLKKVERKERILAACRAAARALPSKLSV